MNLDDRPKRQPSWLHDTRELLDQLARPGMGDVDGAAGEFLLRGWIAA